MQTTLFFARSVLALFLLAITGFGGINDVVYYEIPLTPAEMTADRLSRLRNIILPTELAAADLQVWTSAAQWFDANYYGPLLRVPSDPSKPAKLWNIRPSSQSPITKYIRISLDSDGKVRRYSLRAAAGGSPGANPPETSVSAGSLTDQSVLMQGVLGANALNFAAEWGGWFDAGIPLLEWTEISPDDARAVNFAGSGFVQLPLAGPGVDPHHVSTWPQGYFPCFHPVTGRAVIFKIDDFIAKVARRPPGGVPAATGTAYSATDAQVGGLARMLVQFSPGASDDELGRQINRVARAVQ